MRWLSNNIWPICLFPANLRTFRLVHDEATGILYGETGSALTALMTEITM